MVPDKLFIILIINICYFISGICIWSHHLSMIKIMFAGNLVLKLLLPTTCGKPRLRSIVHL